MNRFQDAKGFSLVELLVAIMVFSVVSIGLYSVMFSSIRGSDTSRSVVGISEEARSGFNRMTRDTREGQKLANTSNVSYNVKADFDNDGDFLNPDPQTGDYEDLTFTFDPGAGFITINDEPLIKGVTPIGGTDVFSYFSDNLAYDFNNDGRSSCLEIDSASSTATGHGFVGIGNNNDSCDSGEWTYLTNIEIAFNVTVDNRTTPFFASVQLRNLR